MKEIKCPHCDGLSVCNIVKRYFERYNRGRLDSSRSTSSTHIMNRESRKEYGHFSKQKISFKEKEVVRHKKPVIVLNNPFELLNDDSDNTCKNVARNSASCRRSTKKQYISLKADHVDMYEPKSDSLWADMLEQEFDDNVW